MELFNQYTTMVERCIETKLKQAIPDFDLGDFMAMVEERKVCLPMGSDATQLCETCIMGVQLSHSPCHPAAVAARRIVLTPSAALGCGRRSSCATCRTCLTCCCPWGTSWHSRK